VYTRTDDVRMGLMLKWAHVDNLLVVSPDKWHSCSQANVNSPRGDSYEVPREK